MVATTLPVDNTKRGTTIANNGHLNSITLTGIPTQYFTQGFELVDDSSGADVTLFCIYIPTSPVSVNSVLMSNAGIPFVNLTVKNIADGSTFNVGVDI
jgi:hypothetical protein